VVFLRPPDDADVAYEFFAPFAHIEGKYEWCRIRSPTHGVFDCFILLAQTTSHPATVYVRDAAGERFMAERYPECETHRVPASGLRLEESRDGRRVRGRLRASKGPLSLVDLDFAAATAAKARNVPYGGTGRPVWGGRYTCWGVDLVVPARARGRLTWKDGREERHRGTPALLTLGSFGRIAPLKAWREAR
jgi:hypothetical protein